MHKLVCLFGVALLRFAPTCSYRLQGHRHFTMWRGSSNAQRSASYSIQNSNSIIRYVCPMASDLPTCHWPLDIGHWIGHWVTWHISILAGTIRAITPSRHHAISHHSGDSAHVLRLLASILVYNCLAYSRPRGFADKNIWAWPHGPHGPWSVAQNIYLPSTAAGSAAALLGAIRNNSVINYNLAWRSLGSLALHILCGPGYDRRIAHRIGA